MNSTQEWQSRSNEHPLGGATPGMHEVPEDPRLAVALEEYLAALDAGRTPDRQELLIRHPEIARELAECLDGLEFVRGAAAEARRSSLAGSLAEASPADESSQSHLPLGDYRIVGEIGRGGMGVVYEAVQLSLGRRVALKVLPFASTLDPKQMQRFKNEAQAAAQLHHANIVPIFATGTERGVHFYAMQLIEGQTLAQVIAELRLQIADRKNQAETPAGTGSSEDQAGEPICNLQSAICNPTIAPLSTERSNHSPAFFRSAANLGVQAAEALEHAHQVGVIHRDIKPANLLVDEQGRLWITDFGLAHCQSQAGLTLTGDVVGTLRYMSPEQALGHRVGVDHRADVYSLGASLYEMLTLELAFNGQDRQELLRQIAFEEPTPLRRLNAAVPAELETIVLKAMAKAPIERYATAQDLADDLNRFLRDEPIRARRPSPMQRIRKWSRRHQPVVATAIAGFTLALAVLAGSVGWIVRDGMTRQTVAKAAARESRDHALRLKREGKLPEALEAAKGAKALLPGGREPELDQEVNELVQDLAMQVRIDQIRLEHANVRDEGFDTEGALREYELAFRHYGIDVARLSPSEVAERIRRRGISAELVAALDIWAWQLKRARKADDPPLKHLLAVARMVDADDQRSLIRVAAERSDGPALEQLADAPGISNLPTLTLCLLADALKATGAVEESVTLLQQAQQRYPGDFWVNHDLGMALGDCRPRRYEEAIRFLTAAAALRPHSPGVHVNLGITLRDNGDLPGAFAAFQKAVALKQDYATAHTTLGAALQDLGDLPAAIAAHRKAIELRPDLALAYDNLAVGLLASGDFRGAISASEQAIALRPNYAHAYLIQGLTLLQERRDLPAAIAALEKTIALNPEFVAKAHNGLGEALYRTGDVPRALAAHQKAVALSPNDGSYHNSLGLVIGAHGDVPGAIAAFQKAISLGPDLAEPHHNLGNTLNTQGDLDGAVAAFERAIALKPGYAAAHCDLGVTLTAKKDLPGAAAALQKSIALQPDLVNGHFNLGVVLYAMRDLAGAASAYERAIALQPDHAGAYGNLGIVLRAKGDMKGAIASYRKSIALKPDVPEPHLNLGNALYAQGKLPEAIAAYQKAIDLKPDLAEAHLGLGASLRDRGNLIGAVAAFERLIALQPSNPGAYNDLGLILQQKRDLPGAVAAFQRAIALKPDMAGAHYNLGNAHHAKGDLSAAISAYRSAARLAPNAAEYHCNLGQTLRRSGQFTEALAALKRGHELGSRTPGWSYPSARWVKECERFVELDSLVPALVRGAAKPASAEESLEFARFCVFKRLFASAARLYEVAFATQPELATSNKAVHRYDAACAAALAGCGHGDDTNELNDSERVRWRHQSLAWLQADFVRWCKHLGGNTPQASTAVRERLVHWQRDADLAGVRDVGSLEQLPEAERNEWRQLWADVSRTLEKTQPTVMPKGSPK